MRKRRTDRGGWWPYALLVVALLAGCVQLIANLRSYRSARSRGVRPELRGVVRLEGDRPGPNLRGANLRRAPLAGAALRGADLRRADLTGADLRGADLRGADLSGALLLSADLTGVRYDARTRWPAGFQPLNHGAVRRE